MKVSAIIPTCDRKSELATCLDSVFAQDYGEFEVIVVDDGSDDGTAKMVREEYPDAVLIENEINVGPCVARNQAIQVAQGELLWFLDSDIQAASEHCLENMVLLLISDSSIGSVGGEFYEDDEKRTFVKVKTLLPNSETVTEYVPLSNSHENECDYLATCNCLVRREHVTEWGGFDESYFILSEDKELGHYLMQRGLRNLTSSATSVYHYATTTSGKRSLYLKLRNVVRFNILHAPPWKLPILPLLDLYYLFRGTKFRDLKRSAPHVMKYLEDTSISMVRQRESPFVIRLVRVGLKYVGSLVGAYLWNLVSLPLTLRTRFRRPNFLLRHEG